ncbi:run domain Beclin-1-interacting and cysteine-rich domain-containing protein isoform X3 [Ahaetulla prasina]|uniref:run domain Beclin-1-interacting and cysteine-rich domain-containing protein isoform X3 n=1 Tax=Ahaetulla prasina TaxID=499056 RepID=UPI0026477DC5|nr:run domain Beclin-1-interacting and cysteine-rich domain-containing protein isoform X3 [Ahaetulla prasina]
MEVGEQDERRREHWTLLGNLKTTVEGLVSINHPNVWSKYGGLERLCRDMHSILYHGLILDKVHCQKTDYWQFVKDVRWLSPHAARHVDKFIHLHENGQQNPDRTRERTVAELWLQHSLQFHCLSAQLKPLLENKQYIRKFYTDSAFLLSDAHVTVMLQCLEAVEQNNPRLLAQIDASIFARKGEASESRTKSLTALLGSIPTPPAESAAPRYLGSFSGLPSTCASIQGKEDRRLSSPPAFGGTGQSQENAAWASAHRHQESRCSQHPVGPPLPHLSISGPDDDNDGNNVPAAGTSPSPLPNLNSDSWSGSQDETDGPEYLAIGNLGRPSRPCDSPEESGTATLNSSGSSTSNLFSSSSSQKQESGSSWGEPGGSWKSSLLRRSSFSEGQTSVLQGKPKRSHVRSHSDTNVASAKAHESNGDISQYKGSLACSMQSKDGSTPRSVDVEYDIGQYLHPAEGMFRRPTEGQSLISYLSEQDFGSCEDLEKENAHFSISESLIAAIELMKCNMMNRQMEEEEEESDKVIQDLKQKIRLRRQQIRTRYLHPACQDVGSDSLKATDSGSYFSSQDSTCPSDSGSAEEVDEYEIRDGNEGSNLIHMSNSDLSVSMASLFSDADIKRSQPPSKKSFLSSGSTSYHSFLNSNSAEAVAMGLLKQFEGMQLPAASELEWLVPEHDAPQKGPIKFLKKLFKRPKWYKKRRLSAKLLLLLPIPDSVPISPDDGEHADIYKLRIRVRGNLEWAPPRPQIIFNIHPAPTRKAAVAKQNYRCAGCGIRTEFDYIKRMRYCEYLGKYFCQCCHENAQIVIPSRILRRWDFGKYYVSNFSKDLLHKIWNDPLFNMQDVNSALYHKVKPLNQVRLLRIQLYHMKNMFKTCRLAKGLLDDFDAVPGHLTEDLHLYSLNDLSAIKKGELVPRLAKLLQVGEVHVEKCMLCQAKGFICEFCQNEDDILFPFELNKCRTCEECRACYHKGCFRSGPCPKCARLQARRELLAKQSLEADLSDYEPEEDTVGAAT